MAEQTIQRSFAGGELAPVFHARADTARYAEGLKTCRNFLVRKEGGVSNRAGLRFVDPAKTDTAGTKFARFIPPSGAGFVIEMGSGYFRFFRNDASVDVSGVPAYNGATPYIVADLVLQAGVIYYCIANTTGNAPPNATYWYPLTMLTSTSAIYEIPTPYALGALPQWKQHGNVLTLTSLGSQPRELVFESSVRWYLRTITTTPTIAPPTGLMGTAGAAGALTYRYVVTAAALETYEESLDSGFVAVVCAEPTAALPNVLNWTAVAGAAEYYVYLDIAQNGVYGFIGTSTTNSFRDTGLVPDFNITPPIARVLFNATNDFPKASSSFQQRRVFANTNHDPDGIWLSRTGFPHNFGIASPIQDDDAITLRLAGDDRHSVQRMVSLRAGLVLLTDGGEWTINGGGGPRTPITPSSLDAEQETYVGIADLEPAVIGNTVLYMQARGSVMRELRFDQAVEGLAGKDLSIWASHLFERKTVVAMTYQQTPNSVVWCVLSDGQLLGLTYIPEQDVWGWHRHDTYTNLAAVGATQSLIEDVISVPQGEEDAVYVLVARVIGGVTKRYIERLARREIRSAFVTRDSFFVDSGLSYSSVAGANVFTGLGHLEGQCVAVLADGEVLFNGDPGDANAASFVINAGGIDLPGSTLYQEVHIGLPVQGFDLETLDLDVQGASVRDKRKQVTGVNVLIERSSRTFFAGPTFDVGDLRQYDAQAWESNALEQTGGFEVHIPTDSSTPGRVCIRQKDPLPLTILGVIPSTDIGG